MLIIPVDSEITIALIESHHVSELFHLIDKNRQHLRQWLSWVDANVSEEDTRKEISKQLEDFDRKEAVLCGIWYGTQGKEKKLVGCIGAHKFNWDSRKTSIGYWLAQEAQGKGIMTRACKAFLDYLFNELNMNRVEIRCAVGNTKSYAIPERLGFVKEGIASDNQWLYDHYVDHIVYSMLAREWKKK